MHGLPFLGRVQQVRPRQEEEAPAPLPVDTPEILPALLRLHPARPIALPRSRTAETTFGGGGSGLVAQPYGNSSNSTITTAPLLNVVIDVPNRNSDRFVEVALNQASGNTGVIIRKADAIELVAEEPTDTPNDEPKHTPHSASNTQDKVLKETT